jgi:hypothetical protein
MMSNSIYLTKFHALKVNTIDTNLKSPVTDYTVWKGLHDS